MYSMCSKMTSSFYISPALLLQGSTCDRSVLISSCLTTSYGCGNTIRWSITLSTNSFLVFLHLRSEQLMGSLKSPSPLVIKLPCVHSSVVVFQLYKRPDVPLYKKIRSSEYLACPLLSSVATSLLIPPSLALTLVVISYMRVVYTTGIKNT